MKPNEINEISDAIMEINSALLWKIAHDAIESDYDPSCPSFPFEELRLAIRARLVQIMIEYWRHRLPLSEWKSRWAEVSRAIDEMASLAASELLTCCLEVSHEQG